MPAQSVASLAALAAIAPADPRRADGIPVSVPGYGWYFFVATPPVTLVDASPWVIAPTTGSGLWAAATLLTGGGFIEVQDADVITLDASVGNLFFIAMSATRTTRQLGLPTNLYDAWRPNIWFLQPSSPPSGGCQVTLSTIWQPWPTVIALPPNGGNVGQLQGIYHKSSTAALNKIWCQIGGGW